MPSRQAIKRERANLKVSIAYVGSTPRCERCDHFLKAETVDMGGGRKAYSHAACGLYKLPVKPVGLCDSWTSGVETLIDE